MTLIEIRTVPICAETSSIIVEDSRETSVEIESPGRSSSQSARGTSGCSSQTPE